MTIGNALSARLSIAQFDRVDGEINTIQTRIAEGTNDPRPSADPARAAGLSAGREQQMRLEGYLANAATAENRLSLTDSALSEMSSLMRQIKDIALEAANTATSGAATGVYRTQLVELRKALVGIANTRDAAGLPLFGGLATGTPFVEGPQGMRYAGDTGQVQVQLSESLRLATGISGDEALMAIPTALGPQSAFAILDDLAASLSSLAGTVDAGGILGSARLELATSMKPVPVSFTLTGPKGAAQVSVLPQAGAPGAVADAINALSDQTGITASLDPDSGGVLLVAAGEVRLSGFATTGAAAQVATLTPTEGPVGPIRFRTAAMSDSAIIGRLSAALDHLAERQGRVGAIAAEVDTQTSRLTQRKLTVDQAIAGLNDLDLAEASTRLASLMTRQQAAMQTYSMINAKTLFDFLG